MLLNFELSNLQTGVAQSNGVAIQTPSGIQTGVAQSNGVAIQPKSVIKRLLCVVAFVNN